MPENCGWLKENELGTGSQVACVARLVKNIAEKISGAWSGREASGVRFSPSFVAVVYSKTVGGTGGWSASVELTSSVQNHWRTSRQCHPDFDSTVFA
jgi:hypothetical protein